MTLAGQCRRATQLRVSERTGATGAVAGFALAADCELMFAVAKAVLTALLAAWFNFQVGLRRARSLSCTASTAAAKRSYVTRYASHVRSVPKLSSLLGEYGVGG